MDTSSTYWNQRSPDRHKPSKSNEPLTTCDQEHPLRKELIMFCENTTIRGVPRIVKATSRRVRLLWACFVAALFIGCTCCVLLLCKQYLEYNVMHPPLIKKDAPSPFPDMTICNMRPISTTGRKILEEEGWHSPRKFTIATHRLIQHSYPYRHRREDYITLTSTLNFANYVESFNAFMQKRPPENRTQLGHTLTGLVVECILTYLNGSSAISGVCSEEFDMSRRSDTKPLGKWSHFLHMQYMNCYTYEPREELLKQIRSIQLILYLDDDVENLDCIDCYLSELKSQQTGAIITIHNHGTFPDLNQHPIMLTAGSLTEIKLKTMSISNKSPPYGRCSAKTPKTLFLNQRQFFYSEAACKAQVIQKDINKECGCQAMEYPQTNRKDLPFCTPLSEFFRQKDCIYTKEQIKSMNLSQESPPYSTEACQARLVAIKESIKCKRNVTDKYVSSDVVEECTLPCFSYDYDSDRSSAFWPTKTWQLSMLNSNRYSKKLRNRAQMKTLVEVSDLKQKGKIKEARALLDSSDAVQRNLLAIVMNKPNFDLHKVEEKEVLSLTSFLSQVGGLLSIFVGLTMVSVVEVLELLIHCWGVFKKTRKDRMAHTHTDSCRRMGVSR